MIPNFAIVDEAQNILRGGQPDDAGWNELKSKGIDNIIKLNTDGESSDAAGEALQMSLVYAPIDFQHQIIFEPQTPLIVKAFRGIRPNTYIHCEHGQDRTGLMVGVLRRWGYKWTKDEAWKEMMEHGFHPELLGLTFFWKWAIS